MQNVWTMETVVRSYQTDFRQCWKPACFFQYMQEAATKHAEHLGYGFEDMMARDTIWLLSRVRIHFIDFPKMAERVIFETWPKGMQQKLFFMRDFIISAGDGRRLALASTAWLLVNPSARRLVSPASLWGSLPENSGRYAMDEVLDRINPPDGMPERNLVQATYSAVDVMGHVNNARYAEWVSDCFSFEEHRQQQLNWIQINYNNEVRPGDRVSISAAPKNGNQNEWLLEGANQTSGLKAFEAALGWKQVEGA